MDEGIKVITLTIDNRTLIEERGGASSAETSAELFLPTTGDAVAAALAQIGIDGVRYKDFSIDDCWLGVPGENNQILLAQAHSSNIDELNYLAVRLAEMGEFERQTLDAVMESGRHCDSIADIINIGQNLDKFDIQPAFTPEQYGSFLLDMEKDITLEVFDNLEQSGSEDERAFAGYVLRLEASIDEAAYGRARAELEGGVFTNHGYLTELEGFEEIYRGPEDIPAEYRVYTAPEVAVPAQESDREPVIRATYNYSGPNKEWLLETVDFPASEERIATLLQNAGIDGAGQRIFFMDSYESNIHGLVEALDNIEGGISPGELNDLAKNLDSLDTRQQNRFISELDYIGDIEGMLDFAERLAVGYSDTPAEVPRTIDGYEVKHNIRLMGIEMIFAENKAANQPYMVCDCTRDNPLAIDTYQNISTSSDYLKSMREFTRRIDVRLDSLSLDRVYKGGALDNYPLTAENCVSGGMNEDIKGKIVIIREDSLAPEYRSPFYQLALATGGFGCAPDSRGQAVFCTELYSGEQSRWNRSDILGVASPNAVPSWAREKLAAMEAGPQAKESVLAKLREAQSKPEQPHKPKSQDKSGPEL